jgi:hypothetical protein
MLMRSSMPLALVLAALPVFGCGGGDDDAADGSTAAHTYLLSVDESQWSEPRGLGQDINNVMPTFLLSVKGSTVTLATAPKGSTATSVTQDTCTPTTTVSLTGSGANTMIGPAEMRVHLVNETNPDKRVQVTAKVHALAFTNVLPSGGKVATDGELTATVDFRDLAPLFTVLGDPTPDAVCSALEGQSNTAKCAACPDDGAPYCLTAKAITLGAEATSGVSVATIDAANVAASCSE